MSEFSSSGVGSQKPKLVRYLTQAEETAKKIFGDTVIVNEEELYRYNLCKTRAEFAVLKGFGHVPLSEIYMGKRYYYPRRSHTENLEFIWREVIVVKEVYTYSGNGTVLHCKELTNTAEVLDIQLNYRVLTTQMYNLNSYYDTRLQAELELEFGEEWKQA